jgi:hypothetical protein
MTQFYWNDGSPYVGANSGIDPGTTAYWHDGAPTINFYQSVTSVMFSKVLGVSSASIKSVSNVPIASISKVLNV